MARPVAALASIPKTGFIHWLLLWLAMLALSWNCLVQAQDDEPRFSIDHHIIRYEGPLTVDAVDRLLDVAEDHSLHELLITSSGGEVSAGINLGAWVFEKQLDVGVEEYCLSSCANYVFTAGRHKRVAPGAVVAWHGNYHHLLQTGLWMEDIPQRMRSTGEDEETARAHLWQQVQELVAQERDFFTLIGVDQHLCWIGKQPPYDVPNYYFLSAPDMARFGVQAVELPVGYEGTDVSGYTVDIRFISLNGMSTEPRLQAETDAADTSGLVDSDSR